MSTIPTSANRATPHGRTELPATGGREPSRRRAGRIVTFLAAAIAVAAASWIVGPILGEAGSSSSPQTAADGLPLPGVVTTIADPASDGLADGTPDDRLPLDDRLAFWAARVEARPDDFLSLVQLATTEAEHARIMADLGGYERASALIDRAIRIVPAYPPTIRARGAIRFALHDFTGALADAETVLTASPGDGSALALRGDASLELGDLESATADYARLQDLDPGPWLDVRLARLASVRGDLDGALALAVRASRAAASEDPGDAGFYAYAVGEYARSAGKATTAREAFEGALRVRPTDLASLVGLARVDAAAGDTASAIEGLRRAAAIAPQPETLILLGDLLASTGDAAGAAEQFDTVALIDQLGRIEGSVYDRVILRSTLDHDQADATTLADIEASVNARPDASGYDLLAWANYRLGRFDVAADAIEHARANGADDARLRLHDGAIRIALGERPAGLDLVRSALALGPALDPIERSIASDLLSGAD